MLEKHGFRSKLALNVTIGFPSNFPNMAAMFSVIVAQHNNADVKVVKQLVGLLEPKKTLM